MFYHRFSKAVTPVKECYSVGRLYPLRSKPSSFVDTAHLNDCKIFYRAVIRNLTVYSEEYGKVRTRNSYAIAFRNSNLESLSHGCFEYFIRTLSTIFVVITKLKQMECPSQLLTVHDWIVQVDEGEELTIPISYIVSEWDAYNVLRV